MEYESPQEVDYRGEFKPELGQLLSQLMMDPDGEGGEGEGMQQISAEQLEELMKNSAELDIQPSEDGKEDQQSNEMLENLMKELARREPNNQQFSPGSDFARGRGRRAAPGKRQRFLRLRRVGLQGK